MNGLNLYIIRDRAIDSKRSVFSIQQLSHLIGKSKSIAKVYSSRLVKKNLAASIMRGKIVFIQDEFVIATQLIEPSYISCRSALVFHKFINQMPKLVECCCVGASRSFHHLGIIYHKLPSKLFYGFHRLEKAGSYIFIADAEKALIDCIYFNLIHKQHVKKIVEKLSKEKIHDYLSRFDGRGKKKLIEWLSC